MFKYFMLFFGFFLITEQSHAMLSRSSRQMLRYKGARFYGASPIMKQLPRAYSKSEAPGYYYMRHWNNGSCVVRIPALKMSSEELSEYNAQLVEILTPQAHSRSEPLPFVSSLASLKGYDKRWDRVSDRGYDKYTDGILRAASESLNEKDQELFLRPSFKKWLTNEEGESYSVKTKKAFPIFEAIKERNLSQVRLIIPRLAQFIDILDHRGRTPLLAFVEDYLEDTSVNFSHVEEIICLFVKYGANVNARASRQRNVLHWLVAHSRVYFVLDIVKLLVESGADVSSLDSRGDTPVKILLSIDKKLEVMKNPRVLYSIFQ